MMVWFQVDDGMWSHPKMLGLSPEAGWLWVRAGAYCAQHLTDGLVPPAALRILGAEQEHVDELVEAGLWSVTRDGPIFHDWKAYQRTREKVEAERVAARQRQSKLREKKRESSESIVKKPKSNAVSHGVTNGVTNGVSHTTRAEPNRTTYREARKRATPAPKNLEITDDMKAWAATNAPGVNLEAETLKMLDYARANGKSYKDWLAAWRNWMRRAPQFAGNSPPSQKETPTPPTFDASTLHPQDAVPMPENVRSLIRK